MSGGDKQTKATLDMASMMRRRSAADAAASGMSPRRFALMTGVALAILQTQGASALTLGELRVQSAVGQPFLGSTTARLGPGETIASSCVSAPAGGPAGFTNPDGLTVTAQSGNTPGSYPIQIRSAQPLYEPMYEIRLQIDCPGGVALAKSFVVMLNLPMTNPAETVTTAAAPSRSAPTAAQPTAVRTRGAQSATGNRLSPTRGAIQAGQSYRVRNGDTLSTIAERVDGRPVGSTWKVADLLFERNPQAFVRGDRDMLKLGALLDIPDAATLAGEVNAVPTREVSIAPLGPTEVGSAANGTELSRREEFATDSAATPDEPATTAATVSELPASSEAMLAEIRAANVAAETTAPAPQPESPFADEANSEAPVENTSPVIAEQLPAESSEVTPTVAADASAAETTDSEVRSSMNPVFAVAAGIGLGLLLALLMLGRNLLGTMREGRARRVSAQAGTTRVAVDAQREHQPVRPAYGGAGIDVELSSEPEADDAPRVSLRPAPEPQASAGLDDMLDELAQTEQFEAPAIDHSPAEAEAQEAGLNDSQTMRNLFDETTESTQPDSEDSAEITSEMATDAAPTAELPALDAGAEDAVDVDVTDLDSLSRHLENDGDDTMSKTLTQALGLLEQDYEDELTASQILEKQAVDEALEQRRREK